MGLNSGVDWTDHTWNPWQGCRKVSPGCLNCYMYRDKKRYGHDPATVIRSKVPTFNAPLKWKEPARVFVCSWSDFFISDADPWREEAWEIMRRTPHLTYMLLTKRAENIKDRLPVDWPLKNVWLGVTAENSEEATARISTLIEIQAPVRFVSVEPMLGPIDLRPYLHPGLFPDPTEIGRYYPPVDWVICGGESGPGARWMANEWAFELKKQCVTAGVPFFMKQMARKDPIPGFLQGREFPEGF